MTFPEADLKFVLIQFDFLGGSRTKDNGFGRSLAFPPDLEHIKIRSSRFVATEHLNLLMKSPSEHLYRACGIYRF